MEDSLDPEQALRDAEDHARAGKLARARAALDAYSAWRRAGGFEPAGGDARATRLAARIGRELRRREDAGPATLAECLGEWWTWWRGRGPECKRRAPPGRVDGREG